MVETVNQHPGPPKPGPTIQNHIMLRAAVPTSQSYTAAPSYNWFRLESGCDHFAGLRDRRPVGESILGGRAVYLARGKSGTFSMTESKINRVVDSWRKVGVYTACPRSSDSFYIVTYYTNCVTTSWTDGSYN